MKKLQPIALLGVLVLAFLLVGCAPSEPAYDDSMMDDGAEADGGSVAEDIEDLGDEFDELDEVFDEGTLDELEQDFA